MKKKQILTTLFFSISLLIHAQMNFKEGYIVNNRQEKFLCLIRNIGNEESTMNYEYKFTDSDEVQKVELSKIEEFGIENELKCIRAFVAIDLAPDRIKTVRDTLTRWEEGHVYLNVLVEGKSASLYSYHDFGAPLFFFRVGESGIVPLVYKKYQVGITPNFVEQILHDNRFRDQLNLYLACSDAKKADRISYTKKDLVRYFENYYKCKNENYASFSSVQVRKGKLLLKPGVTFNSIGFAIQNTNETAPTINFSKVTSFGFGLETEYVFPFNRYKWSLFVEANWLTYKSNNVTVGGEVNPPLYAGYAVELATIELPIGIKYNMNLDKNNRLFVKTAFVPYSIMSESYISFTDSYNEKFTSSSHLLFGIGYNYRSLSMECRYYTPTNVTQNIIKRSSDVSQLSFKLSYAFQLFGDR
jgi:hypothetical protein